MTPCRVLLFAVASVCNVNCGRILGVFPFIGKSHFFVFESVLVELAKRGHDVTVISQFPKPSPPERYRDIDVRHTGGKEIMIDLTDFGRFDPERIKMFSSVIKGFEKVLEDENVESVLNSTKFDLVMTEIFFSDMYVGLAHRLKVPLIEVISSVILPWSTDSFGIPDNPSYLRVFIDTGAGPLSFYERVRNCIEFVLTRSFYRFFITSNDESVSKKHFGEDVPHVTDMMKKASLLLVNSHFTINGPRPLPPQVIEIGGVHIKPAKPLPLDIEKFINESEHGVVYFSLGSVANASSMPEETRTAFINSFAKLKQRVLWKWELDEMPGKPDNVKIVKWMPQRDVLAHPNVRVFMSHGGLLGTTEGVYNAVPMIGIPVFGDQYQNIGNLVNAGSAVLLDLTHITEDSVTKALTAVLEDPNYKKNAERLSKLFRDRPASPLDTAIYWIEYVMRHNGAHHLRTAAVDLPWYQYLLLDVIAFLALIVVAVIIIITKTIKLLLKKLFSRRKEKKQ